ncbi:hypothetical protein SRHO_G00306890 [Serrasalmus rhombeus]
MAPLVEGYRGAEHVVGPLHVASVNWLLMAATFPVKKEARASAVRQKDLAAAQEEYHLPKRNLVSETPTRWGSRQQMVKRAITEVLSKDKKTSVSFLKPVMHLFNASILKEAEDDTELTRTIKTTVMGYLNEKYDDPAMDDLLDMACLVDLRFKLQYTQE